MYDYIVMKGPEPANLQGQKVDRKCRSWGRGNKKLLLTGTEFLLEMKKFQNETVIMITQHCEHIHVAKLHTLKWLKWLH